MDWLAIGLMTAIGAVVGGFLGLLIVGVIAGFVVWLLK